MRETTPYFRRLADCVGKEPFASPQLARKVLRRRKVASNHRRGKEHRDRAKCDVYRCPHCSLFHIGTNTKSVHARRQRDHEGDDQDMS
jgi:hypothetical protein